MSLIESIAAPDKEIIRGFFDEIAGRYDFLNTLLSLRLDEAWRKAACDLILTPSPLSSPPGNILDLGVGTGKFIRLFLEKQDWERAAALDFSAKMLESARHVLPPEVELVNADFHDLPFPPESFDLVVSAFTLRSVKDMPRFLAEVHRILTAGGKAAFLCLTRPKNRLWKLLYGPYLNFYVPLAGRLFSGSRGAYQFLSQSIQTFQEPEKTAAMMHEAGFGSVEIHPFTFGCATLLVGHKGTPPHPSLSPLRGRGIR